MIDTTYSEIFNLNENKTLEVNHVIPFGSILKFSWSGADATDGTIDLQLGSEGYTQNATSGSAQTLGDVSGNIDVEIAGSYSAFKWIYSKGSNTTGTYKVELIRGEI